LNEQIFNKIILWMCIISNKESWNYKSHYASNREWKTT